MLRINQLKLPVGHTEEELYHKAGRLLHTDQPFELTIRRRSIDARKKPELYFNYVLDVTAKREKELLRRADKKQVVPVEEKSYSFPVTGYRGDKRPVIIGMGPAGLFCGYMLAQAGFRPILLERGREVSERSRDVAHFWETGVLNPESNVQFGEGGAGTFSDGKLNTLVKDKYGRNRAVLSIFAGEGAPGEILYDYKPHIGTDVLMKVVRNMRETILLNGGEVRFGWKAVGFEVKDGAVQAVLSDRERLAAEYVVLAPGHSARDTFKVLWDQGFRMEAKPFAVGFRVEHPQEWINLSQYGRKEIKQLGSAPYKVTANASDGRGVYSFCMCPGGYVVNASSEPGRLAINGMSYSGRSGSNSNSAIIVTVNPEDYGDGHPLSGIAFQRRMEEAAWQACQGRIPVERYGTFRNAVFPDRYPISAPEQALFEPAIKGKWEYGNVHQILPDPLNRAFVEGMEQFGKVISNFNHEQVLIEGVESRTSSPVRILRDDSLQASIRGIYPCGEGAGYAGGITSAAMDGIKVAEEIAEQITKGRR